MNHITFARLDNTAGWMVETISLTGITKNIFRYVRLVEHDRGLQVGAFNRKTINLGKR